MHNVNTGYSIVAKIKEGHAVALQSLLAELNKDPGKNTKLPLDDFQTTHFVNIIVIPEQEYGKKKLPASLLVATSFSGPLRQHTEELLGKGAQALTELFQHCEGFPDAANATVRELKGFIKKYRRWDTFYSGMQQLSKNDILRTDELRKKIQDFIYLGRKNDTLNTSTPEATQKQVQEYIKHQPGFEWAGTKKEKSLSAFITLYWSLGVFIAVTLFLLYSVFEFLVIHNSFFKIPFFLTIAILVFLILLILAMRKYERKEQFVQKRPDDAAVKRIASSQHFPVLNTMCVSGGLKSGWLRPVIFQLALRAVIMVRGFLTIPTVYTARWIAIDGGRRLVFISNFENFTETYVRDFIDNRGSAKKINLLFGQGSGYPPTKWFLGGGALDDPNAFLYEVMANHHLTDFWYCPYHHLSIENINTNRRIAEGLNAKLSGTQTIEWLQLL